MSVRYCAEAFFKAELSPRNSMRVRRVISSLRTDAIWLVDRLHTSVAGVIGKTGGIRLPERCRSKLALRLEEREEISRAVVAGESVRAVAGRLFRSPSTISREIARDGGSTCYRAAQADQSVDMNFIPYASASKIAVDVMGGHLDMGVSGLPALLEHIKGGKLSGVGVLSKDRDLGNKDMISAGETPELKGAEFFFWTGLFAPKGTAAPIVNKLNVAFAEVLKEQKVRSRFEDLGVKISEPATPQDFGNFVAQSNAQYEQLVKQSGTPKN
ncbi:MAG: hypothetical protein EOO28_09720 [Comamonadaceae bacterium]|nr:MAG: hypothetical protein EOO28_09720 [Comamonadaceae bacterium]